MMMLMLILVAGPLVIDPLVVVPCEDSAQGESDAPFILSLPFILSVS